MNFYIGSTIRALHHRIKEHLTISSSSVFKHLQLCKNNTNSISIEIIGSDPDDANLRLREAMLIKKWHPSLNSREELNELRDFLF